MRTEENTGIPEIGYNKEENLAKLCNNYLIFENDGFTHLKGNSARPYLLWNHEKHIGAHTHFVISAFNTKLLSHFSLHETTLKCESSDRNGTKAKKQVLIIPFSYCSLQVVIKRFTDLL